MSRLSCCVAILGVLIAGFGNGAKCFTYSHFEFDPKHPILSETFQNELSQQSHSELSLFKEAAVLLNAVPSLNKKTELAQKATRSIYLSTMVFYGVRDSEMDELLKVLIDKAQQGIPIYFIVDDYLSSFGSNHIEQLQEAGVHVAFFNTSQDDYPGSIRWHEKLFIVDDEYAIVGGQNLYNQDYPFVPFDFKWRDTDVYLSGPVAKEFSKHFRNVWKKLTRSLIKSPPAIEFCPPDERTPKEKRDHTGEVRFIYNEPYQGKKYLTQAYKALIAKAQHTIIWQGNNLYLNDEFNHLILEAAHRGVNVYLVTNSISTSWWQTFYYVYHAWFGYKPFKDSPVHLCLYQERFNHSKMLYIDGVVSAIGSANHDSYSLENDAESTALIYDRNFNRDLYYNVILKDLESTDCS
ncbi:MAG: phosphatidylserine/phosphatidylglycerophosphate/cardiolipin synthase family protein [Deltaproteobacteria bacterium]|nr:phosphatidylserine/phosphatidylglycerophosphate/cardiolipin synthase family protein [Deltaproteobacteria bacterium]